MSDVIIEFKKEIFYGDTVIISVAVGDISKVGFDIYYKFEKQDSEQVGESKKLLVATAKTGMVCYNYEKKTITAIPEEARIKLTS